MNVLIIQHLFLTISICYLNVLFIIFIIPSIFLIKHKTTKLIVKYCNL